MSHRKFEHPRCGSMGFLPRKRTRHHRGRIRSFPKDDPSKPVHLTAFMGYKAGMTHVVREVHKPGSKRHQKEIVDAVTIIETPPMVIVGMVGYIETPKGLRALTTVWTNHISDECKRRFYKNWYASKNHKAFSKYAKRFEEGEGSKKSIERDVERIRKYCKVLRVIAHTQIKLTKLRQKKAHIVEIQINGGNMDEKIKFAREKFEGKESIHNVFNKDEMIDTMGVTKGHGTEGVIARWGCKRLQRKTHRGLRKVGCIGPWHPSRVCYTVPRSGQYGYHHRTEMNKKVYRLGKSAKEVKNNATTDADLTEKNITPLGILLYIYIYIYIL